MKTNNFELIWQHNQGALFLKQENSSLEWKKSLAEYFYRHGQKESEIKLKIAVEALESIRKNNRFCGTDHSSLANYTLFQIEEIENETSIFDSQIRSTLR